MQSVKGRGGDARLGCVLPLVYLYIQLRKTRLMSRAIYSGLCGEGVYRISGILSSPFPLQALKNVIPRQCLRYFRPVRKLWRAPLCLRSVRAHT